MMTAEQRAAFVAAQAAMLNAEITAMVAENMERQALGRSMAYTEKQFDAVIRRYEGVLGHNAVVTFFLEH